MAVSYSAGTPGTVTVNSTSAPNTWADVVTAVGDTARAQAAISESGTRVYLINDLIFDIQSGGQLIQEEAAIVAHVLNRSNQAFSFANATSILRFGVLDESSPGLSADAPVTSDNMIDDGEAGHRSGCHYMFACDNAAQTWAGGDTGTFDMFGGMLRFWEDWQTPGSFDVEFPTETEIIQCNVENFPGGTLAGTGYRLQECTFKSSTNGGLTPAGSSTNRLQDIIFHDMLLAIDLASASSDVVMKRVGLRGNTSDIDATAFTGDFELRDSDSIAVVGGGSMGFSGGGAVLETNSYNVAFVNPDGTTTGLTALRSFVYQASSDGTVGYGAEQAGATPTERVVNRYGYDSTHTTVAAREVFGNFAVRARLYGKKFIDAVKVPGEVGLSDTFIVEDNSQTVLAVAAALALTGIAIDEPNKEIDLTSAHDLSEIYDYLQATLATANNLDLPEILSTTNSVSYRLHPDWSFTGLEFLDLSGGEVIVGRYVPVTLTGVVQAAEAAVVNQDASPPVTLITQTVPTAATQITLATPYTAAQTWAVRARLAGEEPFVATVTASPSGLTLAADLQNDPVYT